MVKGHPTGLRAPSLTGARAIILALAAALLLSVITAPTLGSARADDTTKTAAERRAEWMPPSQPMFNNPYGGASQATIENALVNVIRHAPRDSIIRIAMYSFDRIRVAKWLVNAHNRGVKVQMLLNDHQETRARKIVRAAIGQNPNKDEFIYACDKSCRGAKENLHTKFLLFSQSGGASNVIYAGSANFTLNAVKWQWNDMSRVPNVGDTYNHFVAIFDDMRKDWSNTRPYRESCPEGWNEECNPVSDQAFVEFYPHSATRTSDPILDILNKIDCKYTSGGQLRTTTFRLSMHTMRGPRGIWLADALRELYIDGCNLSVIYGKMGLRAKLHLGTLTHRGRVPLRSAGFDRNNNDEIEHYTHQKYFMLQGKYANDEVSMVFTGSSNWSDRGTTGDDILVALHGKNYFRAYMKNFNFMWNSNYYTRNAYTTTAVPYQYNDEFDRPIKQPGQYEPQSTTSVKGDGMKAAGPTWESD